MPGVYHGGEEALLVQEHTQPQQGAEQERSHGQEKGRLRVSREQTPAPAFLLSQEEAIFKQERLA